MSTTPVIRPVKSTKAKANGKGKGTSQPAAVPEPAVPAIRTAESLRLVADMIKHASDPTRLAVLLILAAGPGRNVGKLCGDLGFISQPSMSHHLSNLRLSRLVETRRAGKQNFYSLTEAGRKLAEAVMGLV